MVPDIWNIDKFCDRIIYAIKNGENIGILSDSDNDGINGGIILYKGLNSIDTCKCIHIIVCDRENSYGINKSYYDDFSRLGVSLVITTDIGISNKDEINYGKSIGIDTIVSDHHPILNEPNCIFVNPEDKRNAGITKYCGAGLSYICLKRLYQILKLDFDADKTLLCHACIATIGDMVPMVEENYKIVKLGLKYLKTTCSESLKWLLTSSIRYDYERQLVSTDVSFGLAPLINSLNRISAPRKAVDYFLSESYNEIRSIGTYIVEKNRSRKELQNEAIISALNIINSKKLYKKHMIFLDLDAKKTFAGLVASFITSDMFSRPSMVVSKDKNGSYYGSMRSTPNCDLSPLIKRLENYCIKVGGHKAAAGVSFLEKNKDIVKKIVEEFGEEQYQLGNLFYNSEITAKLKLNEINDDLIEKIYSIDPYGVNNESLIFYTTNVIVSDIECRNFNTFIKLEDIREEFTFEEFKTVNAIAFKRDYTDSINIGDLVNILYELSVDGAMLIKEIKTV